MEIKVKSCKYREQIILIDDEDWDKIKNYNLYTRSSSKHHSIYAVFWKGRKVHRLHRFLLNVTNPKVLVDHINGNALDNRRCNLRITDSSGNNCNSTKRKNATSNYKGVHWCVLKQKCQIQYNKKKFSLGAFTSEIEAAKRYNEEALRLQGEYAKLNIIEGEK